MILRYQSRFYNNVIFTEITMGTQDFIASSKLEKHQRVDDGMRVSLLDIITCGSVRITHVDK